jgi:hypothetical protein
MARLPSRSQTSTTSWDIATAHPFAGEGFRALWNEGCFSYNYFAVRDPGFGLALALGSMRRKWKEHPEYGLSHYAERTQLALYPALVASAFRSFAYVDLRFLLVMTRTMLRVLSVWAEEAIPAPATPPVAAGRRALITQRPAPAPQPRPHHA